jgi:VanZ family protein
VTNEAWIRGGCGVAAFFMAVTLFAGAEAVVDVPLFPPGFDKVAHFTYYGIMAVLLAHAVGIRWLWVPLVLMLLIGMADEWNQALIAGRDSSALDWVADAIGAGAFVFVYWKWAIWRRGLVRVE